MNIILLCGGSGKRLWPLTNDVRSKQFLKVFPNADGTRESMIERMLRMIGEVIPDSHVVIAVGEDQIKELLSLVEGPYDICTEPQRRDTFPSILLASAYLKKQGTKDTEPVVVCPVDSYVGEDFFAYLKEAAENVGKANLTLIGIEPSCPSEKYGYIIPDTKEHISSVSSFREKPDVKTAKRYIAEGALWSGGVFAFQLSYALGLAEKNFGTDSYGELLETYGELPKESFDRAVVEKEKSIDVIRFPGKWEDVGTWAPFSELFKDEVSPNVIADDCPDTTVINKLGIPVVAIGIKNAVIVATVSTLNEVKGTK